MAPPLPPIGRDDRRLLVQTEDVMCRFARHHPYTVESDLRAPCFERKPNTMTTRHVLSTLLLAALGGAAQAAPFTVSADGTEVTDSKTGLIWRRCAQGMTVATAGGAQICTGTASIFTHEGALAHARDQAASTGVAWRLPNVKELSSIVDRSKASPSIDPAAFPATPAAEFWSSTPYVGDPGNAWVVRFSYGYVDYYDRNRNFLVRLVRAGQ